MSNILINEARLRDYFKGKPVELVYLLGSQATSQTKPYSDIDIGVLFSEHLLLKERFSLRLELIGELISIFNTDNLDVIDLSDASPFLRFEAIKHRRELFVRGEDKRITFETNVLSDYFDRQYYLKRHTALGMEALKEEYGVKI